MAVLALSACSGVTVKDEIFYGNKGTLGAVSFHTLTAGQQDISPKDWANLLATQPLICSSIQTFGDLKAALEQLCIVCNCCTYDQEAAIDQFFNEVNSVGGSND